MQTYQVIIIHSINSNIYKNPQFIHNRINTYNSNKNLTFLFNKILNRKLFTIWKMYLGYSINTQSTDRIVCAFPLINALIERRQLVSRKIGVVDW